MLRKVIPYGTDLLKRRANSQNVSEHGFRCTSIEGLEVADREVILSLLGYC